VPEVGEELSEREIDVLRLVATGASNKEIARQLDISVNTVKVHMRNIFAKMDVRSRTEAIMVAIEKGLVQPAGFAAEVSRVESHVAWWQGAVILLAVALAVAAVLWPTTAVLGATAYLADAMSDTALLGDEHTPGNPVGRWAPVAQMPTARTRFASVLAGREIVVVGGDEDGEVSDSVEIYDIASNTWRAGSRKPTPASNVGAVLVDGRIVVPGGYLASGRVTNVVEIYNLTEDLWESGPPLPKALCAYAVATDGIGVYLFGGWDGERYVSDVYYLNSLDGFWSRLTAMPAPRGHAAAVFVSDRFYVIGGYDGAAPLRSVHVFSPNGPSEAMWQEGPELLAARAGLRAVSVGETLYALGGGWQRDLSFGEVLSLTDGDRHWKRWDAPVVGPWRHMGMVATESTIYAFGGWNRLPIADAFRFQATYEIFIPLAL